ncbi:MAG: hypothetical protein AAGJ92_04270 [Pseudomonadota bacterium]
MKTMLLAFAAIIVLTVGANLALDTMEFDSGARQSGDAVRLD